jgi:hypothetical protein
LRWGSTAEIASAAEAPQIATAPPSQQAEPPAAPKQRRENQPAGDRQHQKEAHRQHRIEAQFRDVAEAQLEPKQGDADTQQRLGGELDSRRAGRFVGEEVEGHADQQGEQHRRRAVMP